MPRDLELGIRLTADGKGFVGAVTAGESALKKLRGETDQNAAVAKRASAANLRLARSMGLTADEAGRAGAGFLSAHSQLLGYASAAVGVHTLTRSISAVTEASIRQEQALALVENRVSSSGAAAGFFTAELARMAAGLQDVTTFGDEAVLETQSILLTFNNLAGRAFERTLAVTLDLATIMRTDLQSAALRLGKALDDPARRIGELAESGITFSAAQEEMIRRLADTNRLAEAQALILDVVEGKYQGAAAAARDTLGGALDALGNTWGDLLEVSGETTGGIQQRIDALNLALKSVDAQELHDDIAAVGQVALVVAGVLSVRGVAALALWGGRAAWASARSQALALSATSAAARIDAARFRMVAGSAAAHRYGRSVRIASTAVRGLSRGLALLGGPAGAALLAGYAIFELSRSSKSATTSISELDIEVGDLTRTLDEYRASLEGLNRAQLTGAISSIEADIEDLRAARSAAAELLESGFRDTLVHAGDSAFGPVNIRQALGEAELAALRDRVDDFGDEIARLEARAPVLRETLENLRNPTPAGVAASAGIGDEARNILDALAPPEEQIRARIEVLEQAREKLLALQSGGRVISVADINEASHGIVALRQELEKLGEAAGADDELESLTSRLEARAANTEEALENRYRRERFLIQTLPGQNTELLLALEAERAERVAEIRAGAAAEAERAAEREAEALRRAGRPALEDLRAWTAELSGATEYSREAVEGLYRERERERGLRREYPDASAAMLAALEAELEMQDKLGQGLRTKIDLLERYNPALADYEERLRAIDELKASTALDDDQADAAEADVRIAAGKGSIADGWVSQIERMRLESRTAAADIGSSFAEVFGPGGSLSAGFAHSAAGALVAGESMREALGNVARQAATQLVEQIIAAGIQWLLLQTVFRSSRASAAAAETASVTAQTSAMTAIAAQNAYASTAAIPVVGPGLAPAAALKAGIAAGALGAAAVAATAAKEGAVAFRRGGVVEEATFFGFGGDRIGLAGEAGPEAILPLARGPDGNLGVRAAGAAPRPVTVNVHIHASDAAGFDDLLLRRRRMIADLVRDALAEDGGR